MSKRLPTKPPIAYARVLGQRTIEIEAVSEFTTITTARVDVTYDAYMRWFHGEHPDRAFPMLDAEMKELFVTGAGPNESKYVSR